MVEDEDGKNQINPNSLKELDAYAEPALGEAKAGERFQFFRHGYYIADAKLYSEENRVFNQIVGLKSSFGK